MIAPATHPSGNPMARPMPISATPMVAIVVHELPVISETTAQITHVATRNSDGWRICSPYQIIVGTTPETIHVPAMAPMSSRIRMAEAEARMLSMMASSSTAQRQR